MKKHRRQNISRLSVPTVAAMAERFLTEHVKVRCKPSTVLTTEVIVDKHIVPALGKRPITAVSRQNVVELHHRLAHIPTQANRVIGTLSQIFNKAQEWGVVAEGTNPCRYIGRYREHKRERFLTDSELGRLGRVLDEASESGGAMPEAILAIRLLILTGCRKSEILTLRWKDVDLEGGAFRLRDAKTGPRVVPLSPAVIELLGELRLSSTSEWVIPGRKPGTHLQRLGSAWRLLRKRAGLEDVRLHDLRHSFASSALALGESLPMIGKLLGHRQIGSTARYAHLARAPVHEAAERVAISLAADIL